jgi:hypothetical protein
LKKILPILIILITCCNKDPYDKKLTRQWSKTEIDNSGTNQTVSNLLFVGNGQVSFNQNYTSWLGEWSTNNGELTLSFENGSIYGNYEYSVKNKGGGNAVNGVSQSAITDLELTPISIGDSLEANNLKGLFSSLN